MLLRILKCGCRTVDNVTNVPSGVNITESSIENKIQAPNSELDMSSNLDEWENIATTTRKYAKGITKRIKKHTKSSTKGINSFSSSQHESEETLTSQSISAHPELPASCEILKLGGRKVAIYKAIRNLNVDSIRLILSTYPEITKERNLLGYSPLRYTISQCCQDVDGNRLLLFVEIIEIILGIDSGLVMETNCTGNNLLHIALYEDVPVSVLRTLLQKGTSEATSIQNNDGLTPFLLAGQIGASAAIIRCFLDHSPSSIIMGKTHQGESFLHIMVSRYGKKERMAPDDIVKIVLEKYPRSIVFVNNYDENTPLHLAVSSSNTAYGLKMILKADPLAIYAQNRAGDTPLHLYFSHCREGKQLFLKNQLCRIAPFDIRKTLLITNMLGNTPLHELLLNEKVRNYRTELFVLVQVLVGNCPDVVHVKNRNEGTPLHTALKMKQDIGIIRVLVEGCNRDALSIRDRNGNTPLHIALLLKYSMKIIYILAQKNSDTVLMRNDHACSPLLLALEEAKNDAEQDKYIDRFPSYLGFGDMSRNQTRGATILDVFLTALEFSNLSQKRVRWEDIYCPNESQY